jgi:hypothetical protein
MRIRPAQSLHIYPRGWGGSLSGLGQCTDPSSGETVSCDFTSAPQATPPSSSGLTAAQWAQIINAGTQNLIGITRALSTPSLTPGTNVIYNPATGQFYNPQTGQVVSPGGTTGTTPAQIASTITPGVWIGLAAVAAVMLMALRR